MSTVKRRCLSTSCLPKIQIFATGCVCVNELRKADGGEYTPRSVCQFVSGLQRHISQMKNTALRLVDPIHPIFKQLHQGLTIASLVAHSRS